MEGMFSAEFEAAVWYWRGPAPFYFVSVSPEIAIALKELSPTLTYGWGMIPAAMRIGNTQWVTSLWPKDGGYIVPLKATVRKAERIEEGDVIRVEISLDRELFIP